MTAVRVVVRACLAALAASVLVLGSVSGAEARPRQGAAFPPVITLPDGFRPEGIAIRGTTAYFGSLSDGDIYAADLVTGVGSVIGEGPGLPSVGLKIGPGNLLYVAGGPSGQGRIVNAATGEILATYQFATGATFVNDVVLACGMAWFTDSSQPVLYGLPLARGARNLPDQADVVTLALTGDYVHLPGFNLNGIARTPDGEALLAVQSASGILFRIDPDTGATTQVDLGGYVLTNGDGLLTLGRTLYVVQNRLNKVAVFTLNSAGTSGTRVKTLKSAKFDVPTTVAAQGGRLYLPNARFGVADPDQAAYTAVRIHR